MSKLSDTLDLVILGAYSGRSRCGSTYGAILCAAYDPDDDTFQTVCKLGTGFSDEELIKMPQKLFDAQVRNKPASNCFSWNGADFWFTLKYVVEVLGSEITKSPVHMCNWKEEEK